MEYNEGKTAPEGNIPKTVFTEREDFPFYEKLLSKNVGEVKYLSGIYKVAAENNLDPAFLAANYLQEGGDIAIKEKRENVYPRDVGITRIAVKQMQKEGVLKDTNINEFMTTARPYTEMLGYMAGLLKKDADYFGSNYSDLSDKQKYFFTSLAYNRGLSSAKKVLEQFKEKGYLKDGDVVVPEDIPLDEYHSSGIDNVVPRMQMMTSIQKKGLFENVQIENVAQNKTPVTLPEVTIHARLPEVAKYFKYTPVESNEFLARYMPDREAELRQSDNEYRKQQFRDFIIKNTLAKYPRGNMSREEWFNTMDPKDRRYLIENGLDETTTYWDDTKRGLKALSSGPVMAGTLGTINGILSDKSMPDDEKAKRLQNIFGESLSAPLNAVSFLNVLPKTVQSFYKDNYTLDDALAGKKNNASVFEDLLTDPLTYVLGSDIAENTIKGVIGKAGKNITKAVTDRLGLELLTKQSPEIASNIAYSDLSKTIGGITNEISNQIGKLKNKKLAQEGAEYAKELLSQKRLEEIRKFDAKYGTNIESATNDFLERWYKSYNTDENNLVKIANKEWSKAMEAEQTGGIAVPDDMLDYSYQELNNPDYSVRAAYMMSPKNFVARVPEFINPDEYKRVVWHELSHAVNIKEVTGNKKIEGAIKEAFKDTGSGYLNPTELWAYGSVNLKQHLKEAGLINSYYDKITPEIWDKASKMNILETKIYNPLIKDKKKFIKLINDMTMAVSGAAAVKGIINKKQ